MPRLINLMVLIQIFHTATRFTSANQVELLDTIKERIRMMKQTVYSHLINHNKPSMQDISWGIFHRNIHDIRTRKIIEALEIRKRENVMNGCIGRTLTLD